MKLIMKTFVLTQAMFFSSLIDAQDFNKPEFQKLMQELQACYENLDKSVIATIEQRGRKLDQELQQLCGQGKESEAFKLAMSYANEFKSLPEMEELQKCAALAKELTDKIPHASLSGPLEPFLEDYDEDNSVCDAY